MVCPLSMRFISIVSSWDCSLVFKRALFSTAPCLVSRIANSLNKSAENRRHTALQMLARWSTLLRFAPCLAPISAFFAILEHVFYFFRFNELTIQDTSADPGPWRRCRAEFPWCLRGWCGKARNTTPGPAPLRGRREWRWRLFSIRSARGARR